MEAMDAGCRPPAEEDDDEDDEGDKSSRIRCPTSDGDDGQRKKRKVNKNGVERAARGQVERVLLWQGGADEFQIKKEKPFLVGELPSDAQLLVDSYRNGYAFHKSGHVYVSTKNGAIRVDYMCQCRTKSAAEGAKAGCPATLRFELDHPLPQGRMPTLKIYRGPDHSSEAHAETEDRPSRGPNKAA